MKRRKFLGTGIGATVSIAVPAFFLQQCKKDLMLTGSGSYVNVIEGDFTTALPVPAFSSATQSFAAQPNSFEIIDGHSSNVFGYGNGILGPVIVANNGDNVSIQFTNNLNEDTNIHWHGLIVPANMDGHPENLISAGSFFNYQFTINQRAGTYWFHPHGHGTTGYQVHQGLAGLFIVRDAEELALNLPSAGYEIPLIIQDKRLGADYNPDFVKNDFDVMNGFMGPYVVVNGVYSPRLDVATRFYRFRILNGSNGRIYNLSLSNNALFHVIGNDGGLLSVSEQITSLLMAPGERADLLIDFSSYPVGTEIFLESRTFEGNLAQGVEQFNIMKFKVSAQETNSFSVPSVLSSINLIPESMATKTRNFDINVMHDMGHISHGGMEGMHTINQKTFDMDRIDEMVDAGSTEIWTFDNSIADDPHPMHIHGVQFQILDRTGGRNQLIATEKGWKDTVLLMGGEKVRVIMTFPNDQGKFVFHCHNLEHADDGMMLNYQIQ